jgi:uncharacterized membrane protein
MNEKLQKRFWEIDFLRGIAIIMMVAFHIAFDLNFFGVYDVSIGSFYWKVIARTSAILFLLLVGVSLTLSYSRAKKSSAVKPKFKKYLKRGLTVFAYGMLITLSTYIFIQSAYVKFGILHLIGLSIIMAFPLLKFKWLNLVLGVLIIAAGIFLNDIMFNFNWLMWLGFVPDTLYTVDYFPLLPWFGIVLIGVFIGNFLYPGYESKISVPDWSENTFFKSFSFLGRNSLLIYLVHHPVILLTIFILGFA